MSKRFDLWEQRVRADEGGLGNGAHWSLVGLRLLALRKDFLRFDFAKLRQPWWRMHNCTALDAAFLAHNGRQRNAD